MQWASNCYGFVEKNVAPEVALENGFLQLAELPYWQIHDHPTLEECKLSCINVILRLNTLRTRQKGQFLEKQLDFFVSYAWAGTTHKTLVDPLVRALKQQGYSVWYDRDLFGTEAEKMDDFLVRSIKNSVIALVVVSPAYFESIPCHVEFTAIFGSKEPNKIIPIWDEPIDKQFLIDLDTKYPEETPGTQILDTVSISYLDFQGDIDILTEKVIRLAENAKGLKEYNGILLFEDQAKVLEEMELSIGVIPSLPMEMHRFDYSFDLKEQEKNDEEMGYGFTHKDHHVRGLFLRRNNRRTVKINNLPQNFGRLRKLEIFCGRFANEIPASVGVLPAIKILYLSEVKTADLEILSSLASLEKLYIDHSLLERLPESFGQLTNLTCFEDLFSESKPLMTLPESFEDLTNLKELSLRKMELSTLPKSIGNLKNLTYLSLSENQLTTLPESFGQLTNLKELWLGSNIFSTLPELIGELINLERLNLAHNKLATLPEAIGQLHNLKRLVLDRNKLTTLPESFGRLTNLKNLSLWANKLTTLPESFGCDKKLFNKIQKKSDSRFNREEAIHTCKRGNDLVRSCGDNVALRGSSTLKQWELACFRMRNAYEDLFKPRQSGQGTTALALFGVRCPQSDLADTLNDRPPGDRISLSGKEPHVCWMELGKPHYPFHPRVTCGMKVAGGQPTEMDKEAKDSRKSEGPLVMRGIGALWEYPVRKEANFEMV